MAAPARANLHAKSHSDLTARVRNQVLEATNLTKVDTRSQPPPYIRSRPIKVASPAISPFTQGGPVALTPKEFHYAFANAPGREESDTLHARYAVPVPRASCGSTRSSGSCVLRARPRRSAATARAVLFISFGEDHVMPPRLLRLDEGGVRRHEPDHGVRGVPRSPALPRSPGLGGGRGSRAHVGREAHHSVDGRR